MSNTVFEPITPGEILKEEYLDEMDIKPGTLAKAIGVDRTAIKNIIDGKRAISAEMALRLGLYFGNTAEYWLNLQRNYDLAVARDAKLAQFEKEVEPFKLAM